MRKLFLFLPILALMVYIPIYVLRTPMRIMWNTGTETEEFRWSLNTLPELWERSRFIAADDIPALWLIGNGLLWVVSATLLTLVIYKALAWLIARRA